MAKLLQKKVYMDFRTFYDWLILPALNRAEKKGKSKAELAKLRNHWGGLRAKDQEVIYDHLIERGLVRVEKVRRSIKFIITPEGEDYARKFPSLPARLGPKIIRDLLELYTSEGINQQPPVLEPGVFKPDIQPLSYQDFQGLFKRCFERRNIIERRKGIVPIGLLRQDLQGEIDDTQFKEYLERMYRQRLIELIPAYPTDLSQQQLQDSLYLESTGKRYYSVQWRD